MTSLDRDDFAILGLPQRYALDRAALDERRRVLQGEVHPDRFAAADPAARRAAMQWAVRINEAHRRLADPLTRAAYLCELGGVAIEAESNTAMPADFLVRQMSWREALDDADSPAAVGRLADEVDAEREAAMRRIARAIDVDADLATAAREVRALMFVERFAADVDERAHALEPR